MTFSAPRLASENLSRRQICSCHAVFDDPRAKGLNSWSFVDVNLKAMKIHFSTPFRDTANECLSSFYGLAIEVQFSWTIESQIWSSTIWGTEFQERIFGLIFQSLVSAAKFEPLFFLLWKIGVISGVATCSKFILARNEGRSLEKLGKCELHCMEKRASFLLEFLWWNKKLLSIFSCQIS